MIEDIGMKLTPTRLFTSVAIGAALVVAGCAGDLPAPTEYEPVPASFAAFAVGDVTNNTVVVGQVKVCKVGPNATFDVVRTAGAGAVAGLGYAIAGGTCHVVAEDGTEAGSMVTVTENPATNLVSITCGSESGACAFNNGGSLFVNQYHGFVLTFTNSTPQTGAEGCTPGYWKQPHHLDSWDGYAPGDGFNATFGIGTAWFPDNLTLLNALKLGGGGKNALARAAVAALLSASSGGVDYPMTTADVIAAVQGVYPSGAINTLAGQLDANNNLGCPLN